MSTPTTTYSVVTDDFPYFDDADAQYDHDDTGNARLRFDRPNTQYTEVD